MPDSTATPGVTMLGGERFLRDSAGRYVPEEAVKPGDLLMDQAVRRLITGAVELNARIRTFRDQAFADVAALVEILGEQYGARLGGQRGNITLTSYDGCLQVRVQVQDRLTFGPELEAAKALVDECIASWSDGARTEIKALVQHAFQVDKAGRINRAALLQLRRVQIADERWQAAMQALVDAERVLDSKAYMRFYRRSAPDAQWEAVSLDLAAV